MDGSGRAGIGLALDGDRRAAFDEAARAIGQPSGRAVRDRWHEQRTKRATRVRQIWEASVPSPP